MKKLFALCAAALAVVGLASCGEEKEVEVEKVPINVWATAAEEEVINALVADYNEKHEIDFEIKFTAVQEGDCGTTLANDPTVNGAPALFLCADDHISTLQSKNIVAEIKNARKERVVESTTSVAVEGASIGDKLYGYPVTSDNGYFLWYDKSVLTADDVKSFEKILEVAEQKGKTVLMDVANGWYANSFIMSPQACGVNSLTWSTDGSGNNLYVTTWDNAKGVKVSEYISGLLQEKVTNGVFLGGSNEVIDAGFQNRSMIAAVSGTWMEKSLIDAIGDDLAACKLPEFHIDGEAYQMASFGGSKVYCINKTRPVEEQKTAAALAELLTSKEGQLVRFEKRQSLPCNIEAAQDARYTEHVSIGAKAFLEQSAFSCVQAKTAESRYWDIGKAIGQAYLDGRLGDYADWTAFLKGKMDVLRAPAI